MGDPIKIFDSDFNYKEHLSWFIKELRRALGLKDLKEREIEAIKKIYSIAGFCTNLSDCVGGISSIGRFLSHDSQEVRNIAAHVICKLVLKAARLLSEEKDPLKVREYSSALLEVIGTLRDLCKYGVIDLSISDSDKLIFAESLIVQKLKKEEEIDEFQCSLKKNKRCPA